MVHVSLKRFLILLASNHLDDMHVEPVFSCKVPKLSNNQTLCYASFQIQLKKSFLDSHLFLDKSVFLAVFH